MTNSTDVPPRVPPKGRSSLTHEQVMSMTCNGLFPWTCSCGKDCHKTALPCLVCRDCRKHHRMVATNLITGEKRYISYYFKEGSKALKG
jgi:hypothetical protein